MRTELEVNHPRRKPPTAVLCGALLAIAALTATACGNDQIGKPETFDLEDLDGKAAAVDATDSGTVFTFDKDTAQDTGATVADTTGSSGSSGSSGGSDSSGSSGATADGGGGTADAAGPVDAGTPDAGKQPITSCYGHCGIFLEGNPCHCNTGCGDTGDCCSDFKLVCTCKANKDCDDNNACTVDTCKLPDGVCKQIPFQNCCASDAECKGGTKCKLAKCLQGTCSLVDKDCDDGIACTADLCDDKSGDCSHKLPPTKCLIDGFCAHSGDQKPGSGGCEVCQPTVDASKWTAKAGSCLIEGKCVAAGTAHATDGCRVCDPKQSTDGWSVKTGYCYIDSTCYVSGQTPSSGATCATCKPTASQTAWSGTPGTCAVESGGAITCKKAGDPSPSGSCATCDPAKSTAGYTVKAGYCLIAGKCIKNGQAGTGADACRTCDAAKAPDKWTPKAKGAVCDDDDACTDATLCNDKGECKGKTIPTCCKTDSDCEHLKPQASCQAAKCLKSTGKCELQKLPADKCCTSGKCCDVATQTVKDKGTQCSTTKIGEEYKCEGKDVYKRPLYPGCSGDHGSKCGSTHLAGGAWAKTKTCADKTTCTLSSKTVPPVCK